MSSKVPPGPPPASARWTFDVGSGWGQEAYYTDGSANASLDGHGDLVIATRRDTSAGTTGPAAQVTSARITTQGRFEMGFGVVSARVRVAGQPGVVSAFWALGADVDEVNWPRAGEIDPAEVRGVQSGVLVEALHMPAAGGERGVVWERGAGKSFAGGFHTFTVERAPGVVVYMVDGRQTASLTAADVPAGSWVFDKPFFLILNLSVGGWAGAPTAATEWPVTMSVDWVRVFT
jgi:beta-glucanase (GH16 family)